MQPASRILLPILLTLTVGVQAEAVQQPEPQSEQAAVRRIPVTLVSVVSRDLERWERAVGQLEALTAPMLAAEVAGRIVAVSADVGQTVQRGQALAAIDPGDFRLAAELAGADIQRLQSLIRSQSLQVKRFRELLKKKSANQSSLDEAEAQYGALKAQLVAARVRLQQAERDIARARITSPVDGRVDQRLISIGDYVKTGTPLFHLTTLERLRVRLPFPESLGAQLRVGLAARLSTPLAPGREVSGTVSDIRPEITRSNRAIEVIIDLDNPGDWEPGASVTGAVRVARHPGALVVPEVSVVRRPAGTVVYVIDGDKALQRVVQTGWRLDGMVEIRSGLAAGEQVVVDGAGFLTDGAAVAVTAP